ncbi:uncharacterized protein [Dermacentor andersoni]|uniref:uncharacterized protein isoform X5 n=1 Tax=Dermacentor andersoni TaxID=34620 RepID=UPI0024170369|nr:uncharacterized protein LOC126538696 isoform X5 [Dermacentor andersoni]
MMNGNGASCGRRRRCRTRELDYSVSDREIKDHSKATYDKVPSSGKSSGGGEVTSTLQQPTPTPVTSAGVQHPVTREQEIIPTPNKGVPPQLPTTLKITPAPPTPAPTTPTTPKPTTTKPPPTTPSVTTTPQSTTPPTTLAPLVDKPPQLNAYICTVASDGEMEMPEDGVCDFTFYESLGKPFERPGETSMGKFATFQSMAAKGQKTQFGISIFALDIGAFLIHLNKQSAKAWAQENLWNHNIHHWGILNIYETIFNQPGYLRNATLSLKRAHEISEPSPTKRVVSYTFLGYYAKQPAGCDEAAEIMKNVYRPTVLVILAHISYTEQEIQAQTPGFECYIMPPTIYTIPESIQDSLKYGHTFFCSATKYNHDIYDYTIAGYDVNYDYAPSDCGLRLHGSYTRTENLRIIAQAINEYPRMTPYSCIHAHYRTQN